MCFRERSRVAGAVVKVTGERGAVLLHLRFAVCLVWRKSRRACSLSLACRVPRLSRCDLCQSSCLVKMFASCTHHTQDNAHHHMFSLSDKKSQLLLMFSVLYIITSTMSTSIVLRGVFFGPDLLKPWSTIEPRLDEVNLLAAQEEPFYPNTTEIAEELGTCDSETFEDLFADIVRWYTDSANTARNQISHFFITRCLDRNYYVFYPSSPGEEELYKKTKPCRQASASPQDQFSQTQCLLGQLSQGGVRESDGRVWTVNSTTGLESGLWDCRVNVPFPTIPNFEEESTLRSQLVQRINARVTYDREYVARRLNRVSSFLSELSLWTLDVRALSVDVDAFALDVERYRLDVIQYKLAMERIKNDLETFAEQTRKEVEAGVSALRNRLRAFNQQMEDWRRDLGVPFNPGEFPSILAEFDLSIFPEIDLGLAELSLLRDAVTLIFDIANAFGADFSFGVFDRLETVFNRVLGFARDIQDDILVLVSQMPQFSLNDIPVPPIEVIPTPQLPRLNIPDLSLPDPPVAPADLLEWFASDYDPPEVFDLTLNRTLELSFGNVPDPSLELSPADYNRTGIQGPAFGPEVNFPTVDVALNWLIVIDTLAILVDVVVALLRLRFKTPGAFKVSRTVGIDTAIDTTAWKKHWDKITQKILAFLKPQYLAYMIGILTYTWVMTVYVQVLFWPSSDQGSYVYNDPGLMSFQNDLYEFRTYNRFNSELTAITNKCLGERNAMVNELLTMESEVRLNQTSLVVWASTYLEQQLGLGQSNAFLLDESEFSPEEAFPEFNRNGTDLCECPHLFFDTQFPVERQAASQKADTQFWLIVNSYFLKAHFFVVSLIMFRIARWEILKLLVLTLTRYLVPRCEVTLNTPVTYDVHVSRFEPENFFTNHKTREEAMNYDKEYGKFIKGRSRTTFLRSACVVLAYVMFLTFAAWNFTLDTQLTEEALVAIECTADDQCDDGSLCTEDACNISSGRCSFTPLLCEDNDPCTVDRCDDQLGCTHNSICTNSQTETEDKPACLSAADPVDFCSDSDRCTVDSCDPTIGCVNTPISCDDDDGCTVEYCDSVLGCQYSKKPCDDSNKCTSDYCDIDLGDCVFEPVMCDDNNTCTLNQCNPATGCEFPVDSGIDCDDGFDCTFDYCSPSVGCVHERKNFTCNDYDPCTADICDPDDGSIDARGCVTPAPMQSCNLSPQVGVDEICNSRCTGC